MGPDCRVYGPHIVAFVGPDSRVYGLSLYGLWVQIVGFMGPDCMVYGSRL